MAVRGFVVLSHWLVSLHRLPYFRSAVVALLFCTTDVSVSQRSILIPKELRDGIVLKDGALTQPLGHYFNSFSVEGPPPPESGSSTSTEGPRRVVTEKQNMNYLASPVYPSQHEALLTRDTVQIQAEGWRASPQRLAVSEKQSTAHLASPEYGWQHEAVPTRTTNNVPAEIRLSRPEQLPFPDDRPGAAPLGQHPLVGGQGLVAEMLKAVAVPVRPSILQSLQRVSGTPLGVTTPEAAVAARGINSESPYLLESSPEWMTHERGYQQPQVQETSRVPPDGETFAPFTPILVSAILNKLPPRFRPHSGPNQPVVRLQDESSLLDDILLIFARLVPLSAQSEFAVGPPSTIPQQTQLQLVNAIAGVLSGRFPARIVEHVLGLVQRSSRTGTSNEGPPGDNTVPLVINSLGSLPIHLVSGRLGSVAGRVKPLNVSSVDGSERPIMPSPLLPTAQQGVQRTAHVFPVLHSTFHSFLPRGSLDFPQPQAPTGEPARAGMREEEFLNYMSMQPPGAAPHNQGYDRTLTLRSPQFNGGSITSASQIQNGKTAHIGAVPPEGGVERQELLAIGVLPEFSNPNDTRGDSENVSVYEMENYQQPLRNAASPEEAHEAERTAGAAATAAVRIKGGFAPERIIGKEASSTVRMENNTRDQVGSMGPGVRGERLSEEHSDDFASSWSAWQRGESPIDKVVTGPEGSVKGERVQENGPLGESRSAIANGGQEQANEINIGDGYARDEPYASNGEELNSTEEDDSKDVHEEEPPDEELEDPYGGWDDPRDRDLGTPSDGDGDSSYGSLLPSITGLIFKFFPLPEWLTLSPDDVPAFDWKRVFNDYLPGVTKLSHAIDMADEVIYNEYCNRSVLGGELTIDASFEIMGDAFSDDDDDDTEDASFPMSFGEARKLPLVPVEIEDEFDKCVNFYKNRTRDYVEEYRQECDDVWDDPKAPGGSRLRPLTIDDVTTCFLKKYDVGRRWFNELFFQPWFNLLNQTSYLSQAVDTAMAEFAYNRWLFPAAYAAANFGTWRACIERRDCFDGEECVPALPAIYGFVLSFCQRTADSMMRDPITGVPLAERFTDVGFDGLPAISNKHVGPPV
ncbi:hypothetical protein TGP89_315900 [Toxoplasma gondii p89]|uniref:Uncharacterized protein n=1 Tax=Toxoplasma gondii p89 TaxID=943119 RepID=A0A086KY82_TOXGO|nr:hypothetical protein TGP89_315900 [Toxoplasma gondii p89]